MTKQQRASEYAGYRTAGIRLREDLLDSLQFHRTDRLYDTLRSIHQFDKAHVVMLTEQGLIPHDDGAAILRAIREMESAGTEETRLEVDGGKHSGEQHLIRTLGEDTGGRINLARSSGDLGQIGRHLTIRDHVLAVAAAVNGFRASVIDLAARFADVVVPAHTFLQHAQPSTLGHWFSMWASVMERNHARLTSLYGRVNQSPAGAAILSGSDFDVDRGRVADLLGFDGPIPHTMDAVFSHDVLLETVATVAISWSDLSRLGDDIELWLASEYQYLDFPDRFCDTSSIMPQKRNPSIPQQLKAQAVKAAANVTAGLSAERGASGQPWMERYEVERILWESMGSLPALLHDLGLMLNEVRPRRERMLHAAHTHWATVTDLAGLLTRKTGMAWRTAHQITAITVRLAEDRGITAAELTPTLVDEAAIEYLGDPVHLTAEELESALDPAEFVARRTLEGGPAAAPHADTLARLRTALAADEQLTNTRTASRDESRKQLEAAIDSIITT